MKSNEAPFEIRSISTLDTSRPFHLALCHHPPSIPYETSNFSTPELFAMSAAVYFLYPHEPEGSTFNMDHYANSHMPQAAE
jgi:hypothetical protein